jgi:hypothetical protein
MVAPRVYPRPVPQPRRAPPSATALRVVDSVAGPGVAPALAQELVAWVDGSARMRRFVEANAPKVRRKLREARELATQRDVRAELLAATRLLGDRRFELAYEATGAGRGGPDFGVTFRAVTRFNVEVTRRRGAADAGGVVEAVLAKLRQLPPSIPNVLVVAVDAPVDGEALGAAMLGLRARADARDAALLARAGVTDPKGFYERFLRLAAVIAWAEAAAPPERATSWTNPSARIVLDRVAIAAVAAALRDASG